MLQKIIIMDFSSGEVHVFTYDPNIWKSGEQFLISHFSEQGRTFRIDECEFMIIDLEEYEGRLPIYIH